MVRNSVYSYSFEIDTVTYSGLTGAQTHRHDIFFLVRNLTKFHLYSFEIDTVTSTEAGAKTGISQIFTHFPNTPQIKSLRCITEYLDVCFFDGRGLGVNMFQYLFQTVALITAPPRLEAGPSACGVYV